MFGFQAQDKINLVDSSLFNIEK
ncbi:hypothetical protein CUJ84_pRLN3000033 (plasmid) [Rhizobium leguminosarum]|uniref:Uncharacterized protein n=1 Tax=Rhizobium leguminosarum TaxID=384 RepID=A0A2K9ZFY3_RHILE|nr:hypothetical protein CUJ84_pRLN3000033 [Rhizobium leguminosarum]